MNQLTQAGVLAEDKLFATLDPTARALKLPCGKTVMLIDTVGLIRRLPHHLVEAFKSTLEQAATADILLNVCDASSGEARDHLEVTNTPAQRAGRGGPPHHPGAEQVGRRGGPGAGPPPAWGGAHQRAARRRHPRAAARPWRTTCRKRPSRWSCCCPSPKRAWLPSCREEGAVHQRGVRPRGPAGVRPGGPAALRPGKGVRNPVKTQSPSGAFRWGIFSRQVSFS